MTDTPSSAPSVLVTALDGPARVDLLAISHAVDLPAGTILLRQGEPGRGAYLLQEGQVEISVRLPGGDTLELATLSAGEVIGESALLARGVCIASARARTPVSALYIAREDFRMLVARRAGPAAGLARTLACSIGSRLAALNEVLLAHTPHEASPECFDGVEAVRTPAASAAEDFDFRAFLPLLPCFSDWEASALDAFVAAARPCTLARGACLFDVGESAGACFATVRGAVEVSAARTASSTLQRRRLAVLGPGRLVGYRGVLLGEPRDVRVVARENTLLLECPGPTFQALYGGDSLLAVRLQGAVNSALLDALARATGTLTRLVQHARLDSRLADLLAAQTR